MKIIGITGGIASGKTTVAKLLCEHYHIPLINADELSHDAAQTAEVINKISSLLGRCFIDENGNLKRKALSEAIFTDERKRKILNSIIHPIVRKNFFNAVEKEKSNNKNLIVYDCPLLFEENLQGDVDLSILVCADESVRLARIMKRDNIDIGQAKARIASQMNQTEKIPLADVVFYNNGTQEDIIKALDVLYTEISK